ncbi:phosphatase PAP2 family protein [Paenibacillus mendelii]|uniref:Phosphatase PAP2 family protein n=1 Tax=Paenibacillus mendelii TaxID=206163 RepID=A0ABV6JIM8_9BACL|nr:phosphatase PAP2 family protein [Paenibacillus mendelii]MCQ6557579.1 phosphatase PAP2 family protein [Paenibacillus mendelii]
MLLRLKRFWPLSTMLVFPVLGMLYAMFNQPLETVYSLESGFDRAIPYIKYFSVPYSIWIFYIYVCLIYFFIKDPKFYYRSLLTYTLCALICYAIYSVFQTTVARPVLTGDDVFTAVTRFIYNRDQPFNCFPSIHCFSSYMVMKALFTSGFRNKWNQILIYGMSSLIIVSTLFVKQHVIIDVLGGILIVEIVYRGIVYAERTFFNPSALSKKNPVSKNADA